LCEGLAPFPLAYFFPALTLCPFPPSFQQTFAGGLQNTKGNRSMRHITQSLVVSALALASAIALWAGGLFVVPGNPEANAEAHAHKAVLTLKLAGCHEPQKALLTATAIGVVDGRKQTITLKIDPLSEPGTYALTSQWPDKGRWVLEFVAKDQGRIASTLVGAGPGGIERDTAKMGMHEPVPEEVAALLAGGPATSTAKDVARN
jgi:hypothetical protein